MDGATAGSSAGQESRDFGQTPNAFNLDSESPQNTRFETPLLNQAPSASAPKRRALMATPAVTPLGAAPSPSPNLTKNIKDMGVGDASVVASGSLYGAKFISAGLAVVVTGALIGIGAVALLYFSFVKPIFNPLERLRNYWASKKKPKPDSKSSQIARGPAAQK